MSQFPDTKWTPDAAKIYWTTLVSMIGLAESGDYTRLSVVIQKACEVLDSPDPARDFPIFLKAAELALHNMQQNPEPETGQAP